MTDLAARVVALAQASAARDQSKRDSVRERFPLMGQLSDDCRRDLPGKWQAWSIKGDGIDMKGGDQTLLTGTYVDLTPERKRVKRA